MNVNYFTCTLGEAIHYQQGKAYRTINEFIEFKSGQTPDLPAIGFFVPGQASSGQPWKTEILSFKDVQNGSRVAAQALSRTINAEPGQTVALLCPSSTSFLFTWLGLIRLGHPVLLIAPQCSPTAIAHLCQACRVSYLLYDVKYEDLATATVGTSLGQGCGSLSALLLPFDAEHIFDAISEPSDGFTEDSSNDYIKVDETDIAYLHHTSGTSSGVPKPIPQTHHAAIGVLPTLDGSKQATFTTTPLYHGGVADLFRSWTSNALIWLFPAQDMPITAANVCKCLEGAATAAMKHRAPEVKYFSSVPYVLQMMANDKHGLKYLQSMDIVGVGGAALPTEVGDRLVNKSVNLVSRFGSAECGFLMSSHRDFTTDKEWQYLRPMPAAKFFKFEPRESGLLELVVLPGWPHMANRNREDGSYATSDLFEPHPTIPNAWRYHSRADSQLTLITGKKFDPAPLEDAICTSSPLISGALVFGTGKPYPGVLLFRSSAGASISDETLLAEMTPLIEKLNNESQGHARIPRNMLIPMLHTGDQQLERSSKGTVLRSKADQRYAEHIDAAYESLLCTKSCHVPDADVPNAIREIVESVVAGIGRNDNSDNKCATLKDDTDLFAYGVDSVASIQIRQALSRLVPNLKGAALPLTIVEDAGTISRLSELIVRLRSIGLEDGDQMQSARSTQETNRQQHQLMHDLVKEYSKFASDNPRHLPSSSSGQKTGSNNFYPEPERDGIVVLVTGPTGSLGSHILHQLLSDPRVSKIHLLVRGASKHASRERVTKALAARKLPIPADFDSKTAIWPCKLSEADLGLSEATYYQLSHCIDVIIHLAWSVNFLLPLRSFSGTHLAGLRNLLNLALACSDRPAPPRFIFCSSVASVSNYSQSRHQQQSRSNDNDDRDHLRHSNSIDETRVPERCVLDSPSVAGPTGYARSKWVAEAICAAAHDTTRLRNRISIARVGQLSGASDTGVWSMSEAYPLMLASAKVTGVLPDLENEILNWLPVDIAARAFVEDALDIGEEGQEAPIPEGEYKSGVPPRPSLNGQQHLNDSDHRNGNGDCRNAPESDASAGVPGTDKHGPRPAAAVAAESVIDNNPESTPDRATTTTHSRLDSDTDIDTDSDDLHLGPPVYHILNPDPTIQWTDLLSWIQQHEFESQCPSHHQNEIFHKRRSSVRVSASRVKGASVCGTRSECSESCQTPRPPSRNAGQSQQQRKQRTRKEQQEDADAYEEKPKSKDAAGNEKDPNKHDAEIISVPFKVVPVNEWLTRLASLQNQEETKDHPHPALKLLGFWKATYGDPESRSFGDTIPHKTQSETVPLETGDRYPDPDAGTTTGTKTVMRYEMTRTYARMPSLLLNSTCSGTNANSNSNASLSSNIVNEAYILKLWDWIKREL
ncbi:putative NRPS-like protein biosynthetic cluster [Exophiala dermatitidis]|nr:putative NRPS-like protein biosynthetic cluster [Exophiala dermatitidis]KAJ4613196.1 putative NRPS-like protein biosynthetic cluster [Exophiala dermatitidis]KAJ4631338.1 putative NRPS-like protein biosynthetic cluster [Exophiala dermatitidis]KAJ4641419.1 putative NRPS-like protein biosynthetic cluster [Exophiala dermatitidis]KAJ4665800.1 putative NRPS-like protein biosynthetic cluster [Exophiala dermatitidis]